MATLTFTRTISAAHLGRVVAALQANYGMPSASAAAIQTEWESRVTADLIGAVKQYEQGVAAKSATDAITDVALTT